MRDEKFSFGLHQWSLNVDKAKIDFGVNIVDGFDVGGGRVVIS